MHRLAVRSLGLSAALVGGAACQDLTQVSTTGGGTSTGEFDTEATPIGATTGATGSESDGVDSGSGSESGSSSSDGPVCEAGQEQRCRCPTGLTGGAACLDGQWGECVCPDPRCGDGVLDAGEDCDDDNRVDTDDCTNDCTNAACGDGVIWEGVEACDDANDDSTDACVACVAATCGDGVIWEGTEECDDANDDSTDDCLACSAATCGDGQVWAGNEECDDANADETDACVGCNDAYCGDGQTWLGQEQCDDANDDPNDACLPGCVANVCGDGVVNVQAEQCDETDNVVGDGCNPDCVVSGSVVWVATHHNANNLAAEALDVAVDLDSNTIVAGWEDRGALGLGSWIRKYDSAGNVVWTRAFDLSLGDDWAQGIDTDPNGNIAVTGSLQSPDGDYDVWTRRYDADGELLWSWIYDSPAGGDDFAADVDHDTGFNVTVALTEARNDLGTGLDIRLQRYTAAGAPTWTASISTPADEVATGLDSAPGTQVVVSGYRVLGLEQAEFVTARYTSFGSLSWEQTYSSAGAGFDIGRAVAVDASGAAVVVGREDRSDIGQGIEGHVLKYAANGAVLASDPIGVGGDLDDEGWAAATGANNRIWTVFSRPGVGGEDIFVLHTTDAGVIRWETDIDGPFGGDDRPTGVDVDPFDYASVVGATQTASGVNDVLVVRLAP